MSESTCEWLQRHSKNTALTPARTSICRHGVSVFGAGALIAPRDVLAFVGAQMADALRALVDVWARGENSGQVTTMNVRVQNTGLAQ